MSWPDLGPSCLGMKYFDDRADLCQSEFEEIYKALLFETDEDAVKVSFMYYTEVAIMGKDKL